jgi:hypothetical protein
MAAITELGIVFQVAKGLFRLSQLYKKYGTRFSSVYDVYYAVCGLKRWGVALYPQNYILGMVFDNYTVTVSSLQVQAQNHLRLPITFIKGTVTSNITNEVLPALIDSYPTEQINPVPPKCKFWVRCLLAGSLSLRTDSPRRVPTILRRLYASVGNQPCHNSAAIQPRGD